VDLQVDLDLSPIQLDQVLHHLVGDLGSIAGQPRRVQPH
jgi:hypothetical protein